MRRRHATRFEPFQMDRRSQIRQSRVAHVLYLEVYPQSRKRLRLRLRPVLLEATASIQNLGWNGRGCLRPLCLIGSFFPNRTKFACGPVLIDRLQIPSQHHRWKWEPAQEFLKICSHGTLALERLDPTKSRQKLRIKLPKQFHLGQ